jgi:endo-1,3-1,4-beta-glycanase ExoK
MVTLARHRRLLNTLIDLLLFWSISVIAIDANASSSDVVLYASRARVRAGSWTVIADPTAAGRHAMTTPDRGAPAIKTPLVHPRSYFELTFPATAGKPYHLWIRGKAGNNSRNNDSAYFQFSDTVSRTGSALYRIGTTSAAAINLRPCPVQPDHGWGWTNNNWCHLAANLFFQNTGMHTVRVQVREDGFSIDQIVLSPSTYLWASPGKGADDTTILAENPPLPPKPPRVNISLNPASGVAPLNVTFTANVTLVTGFITSYKWAFGDGQTSSDALPSHVYENPGSYNAKVTISDNLGNVVSAAALVSVRGSGSFSDTFSSGILDASKWLASDEPAPGRIPGMNQGSFVPSNVDLSKGVLCLKLQQQQGSSGIISVGGQIQSLDTFGYGTYEWTMRASSTSATPNGPGSVVSGQISSGFSFVNDSQTEIDYEIEGQHPNTIWMTNWLTTSQKQYSSVFLAAPDQSFHRYRFVWTPGKVDFYIDGVLVSTHTSNIPSVPAYIMVNHWGTNSTGWGGSATVGVERYVYISNFVYTPSF